MAEITVSRHKAPTIYSREELEVATCITPPQAVSTYRREVMACLSSPRMIKRTT